jgi:arabinofuranosyltransferase
MSYNKDININRKHFILLVIFFILYCLFLSWSFLFQNVDDAYISFRYGKNLMNGNGLVYNKGEYVEGFTNFMWTVITAPFTLIKSIDISRFAILLGLMISIFNIYFVTKISRQFSEYYHGFPAYFVLLPSLFFVLDDTIAFWAVGGMEFPLYILFILGITYFYFRINDEARNYLYLSLFFILCTLTRPEGNMIFILTIVHSFLFRKKIINYGKKLINIIIIYAVFVIIYYGFKYLYYGQVIPNTFYAKGVTDLSMNLWLGLKYITICIGTRFYMFFFILFIPFKSILKDFKQSFLFFFLLTYILYIWGVGGDWMISNRFFVPVLPIFYVLCSIGFSNAINKFVSSNAKKLINKNKISNVSTIVISLTIFLVTLSFLEYKQLIIKDENYKYEMQWSMFGKWLKSNVAPNTVIAVGPAGKIPYYSELYTIDMWGLNNSYIAKKQSIRLQAGHKKFDFEYVLSQHPEFIIGYAGFTDANMPKIYEKFNAPEEKYKSIDVVFRLKPEYRNHN